MVIRWVQYKFYFFVLCLVYLFLMAVLQSQLQLNLSRGLARFPPAEVPKNPDNMPDLQFSQTRQLAASDHVKPVRRVHQRKWTSKPPLRDDCLLPAHTDHFSFQPVIQNLFYVYSAYKDERYAKPVVRIIAMIARVKKKTLAVQCSFKASNLTLLVTDATVYEMCENHNKKYGGYILWCDVPIPNVCQVNISVKTSDNSNNFEDQNPVTLNMAEMNHGYQPFKFGICVPPLFGSVPVENLIEFMELSILLGAEHFIFYDFTAENSTIKDTLSFYKSKGYATVVPWTLPNHISEKEIWYHGQLLAHNDCILRGTSLINIMSINDIDEFIIPHINGTSWQDVFPPLLKDRVIGLSFNSAFFDPTKVEVTLNSLQTLNNIMRTELFSKVRTKVMVKPAKVFEVGIHHVSKPYLEGLTVQKVDVDLAYLHHYRKCVPNYGMRCANFVQDKTLWQYKDLLEENVINTYKTIKEKAFNVTG